MMIRSSMNKNIIAIKKLAHLGKYQEAAKIADDIRWGRVKDVKTLNMVSDIYEKCENYQEAKRVMMVIYNRVDANKRLVYKLCELSAKAGDLADAEDFYWEFSKLAPKDPGKLILAYHIMRASNEPDAKKIEVLELYIKEDFDDKWAYKLAQLYYKTGQTEKCVGICDEIILWYSGDRYGEAALRLKHKCLGIEDESVQPKVAGDTETDNPKGAAEESVLDGEDVLDNDVTEDHEEVIMDEEEAEKILAERSEDKSALWFDLKTFNKDIITREVEEDCFCEDVSVESCQADVEEVLGDTVDLERRNCGIVLEKSTEREKVFVFSQDILKEESERFEEAVEPVEETPEEIIEAIEETPEEIIEAIEETPEGENEASTGLSKEEEGKMFTDNEIFIEADIADCDEGESLADDIFTEEIYVDEDVYSEEVVEAETHMEEVSIEGDEAKEFISEEESGSEETAEVLVGESEDEEAVAEEADSEVSIKETACAVEDNSSDREVRFVGYIDEENNFKPAEETGENGNSKKIAEHPIAETTTTKQINTKPDYNNKLKIFLIECSQMRGGVKYAANKLHSIHRQNRTKLHGVAKISDSKFSVRGAENAISVLKGRDLVIEGTEGITYEAVNELVSLLDEDMKPTILVIVDTPAKMALFVNKHRTFAGKCEYIYEEASISRKEFLNYINNYAYKLDAVLDDMAEEELEYIADEMIEDCIAFTISDAAALVERALEKAQKPGFKGLFEAKKDSDGYLILRARHFDRG